MGQSPVNSNDFAPSASWDVLRLRAELLQRVRLFFSQYNFLEVETPLLSSDIVVDQNLDPFKICTETGDALYLQTSPEAAMKRLVTAGGKAIYQVTRSFRQGERGALHNPEFTIVEWYRTADSYESGMRFLGELISNLLPCKPIIAIPYEEVFQSQVGMNPHVATNKQLFQAIQSRNIDMPECVMSEDRNTLLEVLFSECVEPQLTTVFANSNNLEIHKEHKSYSADSSSINEKFQPIIVYDFPVSQAALAKIEQNEQGLSVARRFELYAGGLELANGYFELTDAAELLARTEIENARRLQDGKESLPGPLGLHNAMLSGLPQCCGVALGFDRVVMLATGATKIDEVIAFPRDRS